MNFYLEFNGIRLRNTECVNYLDARLVILKVLDQCIMAYKKEIKAEINRMEEIELQEKILRKLKIVKGYGRTSAVGLQG